MAQIPLLVMADSIAGSTGLGRVGKDITYRIYSDPDLSSLFRVGSFGVGGPISSSARIPFHNCSILRLDRMMPLDLPAKWEDFAGRYGDALQEDSAEDLTNRRGQLRKGILLTIWNLSWTEWLSQPYRLPVGHPLRDFLLRRPESVSADHWSAISSPSSPSFSPALLSRLADAPFQRWLYCPVDGHLPDGTLGHQLAPILAGFDKVVAYTRYGAEVIERTLEKWLGQSAVTTINSIPNLPHGLDRTVFFPRDRALARQSFFPRVSLGVSQLPLLPDQILLAMTGTNSARKTFDVFFQTGAELLRRGVNVFLWAHTDALQPTPASPATCWNLPALIKQYGLDRRVAVTTARIDDDSLAWAYSAADVMIATSSEGFGYSPFEALACGLPVVGTSYSGSSEFTPPAMRVDPVAFMHENPFGIQRPLYNPADVADRVQGILALGYSHTQSLLDAQYEWDQLWPRWREWLKAGVR